MIRVANEFAQPVQYNQSQFDAVRRYNYGNRLVAVNACCAVCFQRFFSRMMLELCVLHDRINSLDEIIQMLAML